MISAEMIGAVSQRVAARHRPAWSRLHNDAAKAKAAGWTKESVLDVVGRAEALAHAQADDVVKACRQLLAPAIVAPGAREIVAASMTRVRAEIVAKLLPGGMTLAKAEAEIAEAEAQDRAIDAEFADLLTEALTDE